MRRILLIVIMAILFSGCVTSQKLIESRHETLTTTVKVEGYESTSSKEGPAPWFVEETIESKITIEDSEGRTITVETRFTTDSENAKTFWGKLFSGLFGFLGGLVAGGV